MQFILRDDDTSYFTSPAMLEMLYARLWSHNIPVCLGVIPAHAGNIWITTPERAYYDPNIPTRYQTDQATLYPLADNQELCTFLSRMAAQGLIEVCLHGYTHQWLEFAVSDKDTLRRNAMLGLAVLQDALPDVVINTFLAPYEALSVEAVELMIDAGWNVPIQPDQFTDTTFGAMERMRCHTTKHGAKVFTGPNLDLLVSPEHTIEKLVEMQESDSVIVGMHHLYQYFEDYGDPLHLRVAEWDRLTQRLCSEYKDRITTFSHI